MKIYLNHEGVAQFETILEKKKRGGGGGGGRHPNRFKMQQEMDGMITLRHKKPGETNIKLVMRQRNY